MSSIQNIKCENCGKIHKKRASEIKKSKSGKMFCCRACAATHNNHIKPKRTKQEKPIGAKQKIKKEKKCSRCKETLTKANAYVNNKAQLCKQCFKQYCSDRWIKLKQKAIEYKGEKCEDCGKIYSYELYDFHHLDPSQKKYTWPKMRLKNWEIIKTELDKCALLCANCHRIRHAVDGKKDSKKKIKIKEIIKRGNFCLDCRETFIHQAYDFHHEKPNDKKFNLSMHANSKEETMIELDKCVLLCANCHRLRHKQMNVNFDK